jgi:iron donor protein CyaY
MQETDFHRLADQWLKQAEAALEEADAGGALELEYQNDALTILFPSGKTLLISKHATTRQLWLASPLSGGLHFIYGDGQWKLQDGRTLEQVVRQELKTLGGIEMAWSS